jgi:hypothetical protein
MRAKLRDAGLPLLVALAGVGGAWLVVKDLWWLAALLLVAAVGLGFAFAAIGSKRLATSPPHAQAAIRWIEWSLLRAAALGAAAAGVAVWLAIDRTANASPENKALITAAVTAVTTFLTTTLIDWTKDSDGSLVSGWTSKAFQKRFSRTFREGTESYIVVWEDERFDGGWGHDARRKRAKVIEERWNQDRANS